MHHPKRLGIIDRPFKDHDVAVMSLVVGVGLHEPPTFCRSLLEFGVHTRTPWESAIDGQDSDCMILKLLHLLCPFWRELHYTPSVKGVA